MSKLYKVHKFAELASVTVRTLHHYDRLGLLEPRRTAAGYRVYSLRDLERLEQIAALKFLGLPLKQIKLLLDRKDALQLPEALRMQRTVLEERRRLLDRAIDAIEDAEKVIQSGKPADAALLKKIIEVIEMQNGTEVMKKYFSEEAWGKWKQHHAQWPSQAWIELFEDVKASLGREPDSKTAQSLAARWIKLRLQESGSDPQLQVGLLRAWIDRQHWPASVKQKVAKFDLDQIARFISQAIHSYRKKYYSDEAWAKMAERTHEAREQDSLLWLELFIEVGAVLGEDPAGEKAQTLARRWMEQWERSTGGDPGIKDGSIKAWADRQHWPAEMQQHRASFNFEKVAEFISEAIAAYRKRYYSEEAWRKLMERRRQSAPEARAQLSREWSQLFHDVQAALGEDPAGDKVQALAARWKELSDRATGGDPEIKEGTIKAWADRKNWPAWQQQRTPGIDYEKIAEFIGKAMAGPITRYFSDKAWKKMRELGRQSTPESRQWSSQARTEFFRDLEAALDGDPAGKEAQALAARWNELLQNDSGGDPDIRAGWEKCWANYKNWPEKLRLQMASHLEMSLETFDKLVSFMEKIGAFHNA